MARLVLMLQRRGPVAFGWLVAVGAVLGLLLDLAIIAGQELPGVALLASLIGGGALLVARRHRPGALLGLAVSGITLSAVAWVFGAAATPGATEMGALLVLVAGTVRRADPAVAAGAVAVVLIDTAAMALRMGTYGGPSWGVVITLWFLVGLAVGVGLWLRYLGELAALQSTTARREERMALARELHDTVAHHVTGIVVQAQAAQVVAEARLPVPSGGPTAQDPDDVLDALRAIEDSGAATMAAMRRFVGSLRAEDADAPLAPAAGLDDLRELVADVSRTGPAVALTVDDAAVPTDVAPTVYRVVRESLTNVRRHAASAGRVSVDVARSGPGLLVSVRDDGPPVPPPPSGRRGGYGLAGLAERVGALGGRLEAGPATGGGWLVQAWIPTS